MAPAAEQDPTHARALKGLLSFANMHVVERGSGKNVDVLELQVAQVLVHLGAEKLLALHKRKQIHVPDTKRNQ